VESSRRHAAQFIVAFGEELGVMTLTLLPRSTAPASNASSSDSRRGERLVDVPDRDLRQLQWSAEIASSSSLSNVFAVEADQSRPSVGCGRGLTWLPQRSAILDEAFPEVSGREDRGRRCGSNLFVTRHDDSRGVFDNATVRNERRRRRCRVVPDSNAM
jgi:hypothetical protein